jgi:hypothetical protein
MLSKSLMMQALRRGTMQEKRALVRGMSSIGNQGSELRNANQTAGDFGIEKKDSLL